MVTHPDINPVQQRLNFGEQTGTGVFPSVTAVHTVVYLRRSLTQIAEMRVNVAQSDPDTTSLNLA